MQEAGDLFKDAVFEACGFTTTKEAMLRKIGEFGEIDVEKLKETVVDGAGKWDNPEKACDANRTLYLYIDELIEAGKIVKTSDDRLKLT